MLLPSAGQVLSNDRFVASNHRVLRSVDRPRHSRVLFVNPTPGAVIKPVLAAGADAAGKTTAHVAHPDHTRGSHVLYATLLPDQRVIPNRA